MDFLLKGFSLQSNFIDEDDEGEDAHWQQISPGILSYTLERINSSGSISSAVSFQRK